ncbi:LPXTG cell wall anchor domain-containing protein [Enterococcus sp. AZ109]|uniref:LPXTG cell wall anchor domain-containing protein n=1 Tax=Enterococcus sp. AZ109 TaxID=2774634 RepID=UPI003F21D9DA
MKKIVVACLVLFFLAVFPIHGEAAYDSNGKTGFYGVYEYPEDKPSIKEEFSKGDVSSENIQLFLPSYAETGPIIPRTGDRSSLLTTLAGMALLTIVGFKVKRGGILTEKNNYSPRR